MTVGTLAPAYVVINYHSIYGTHKATIGTKEWFPSNISGGLGSYESWNGNPIDAEEMIQAYVDAWMAFYPTNAAVDGVEIWTKADADSPAYVRRTAALSTPGTDATPPWTKAIEQQWIFRADDFSIMKFVWLDAPAPDSWDSLKDLTGNVPAIAVYDAIVNSDAAWMSRKNGQPQTFIKVTYKLNDKLREEYDMN